MRSENVNVGSFYRGTLRVLVLFLFFSVGLISCKNKPVKQITQKSPAKSYYTCSMHTQIMLEKPGTCPICGMKLIEVSRTNTAKADEIQLSQQQIQLGNILVDTINDQSIGDKIVFTGTLNFNLYKAASVSARVAGRIEKLHFKNIGDYLRKGDKLFDLYSEELNNARQEYIYALQRKQTLDNSLIDYDRLIQSAKNKLLLWGLTEKQIQDLANSKQVTRLTSFSSTESGYITELDIKEGDYVMEGGKIVSLADLSTLWAEAQVYTSQMDGIDKNGTVTVQIPDMPGKEFKGHIEFVNPEINPDTRIDLVRVVIPNADHQLKPGMPAYLIFRAPVHKAFTLPLDAVLRDGTVSVVWVKTGKNTFKNKMVETGLETENNIEIKSGLQKGDIVVINGAYLLNSEYKFKKGSSPMGGMKM
ncbi:efflux RND transporter periplasmic adaptor subunit [Mucilaginibacter sp.]|uniref:efflux RND transporter periplasmic adaptor subunit n=1 Tax=Mucilaginibacter sp. TaxID=1882438 RepID=UPI00374D3C4A